MVRGRGFSPGRTVFVHYRRGPMLDGAGRITRTLRIGRTDAEGSFEIRRRYFVGLRVGASYTLQFDHTRAGGRRPGAWASAVIRPGLDGNGRGLRGRYVGISSGTV